MCLCTCTLYTHTRLCGEAGGKDNESAEDFFKRVMEETGTLVLWPSKLKIGAKSKKGKIGFLGGTL